MKKIATIRLEDKGQDFLELDILSNGVILGSSVMFSNNRISMIGIGSLDGDPYFTFEELKKNKFKPDLEKLYIYMKGTGDKEPLPWEADTLKYKIIK